MEQPADADDLQYQAKGLSELLDPNSLLSPYIPSRRFIHCPADNYIDAAAQNSVHVRSFSMNSAVGTTWNAFYANGSPALGARFRAVGCRAPPIIPASQPG